MIRKIMFTASLILFSAQVRAANYYSTGTTSVFTNRTTWLDGSCAGSNFSSGSPFLPGLNDKILICDNSTVTLTGSQIIRSLEMMSNSTLALGSNSLTIIGNLNGAASSSITGTGSIIFVDNNASIDNISIPKVTLPNNPAFTLTFTGSGAVFVSLTSTPNTSPGQGFIFAGTISFPSGTVIDYCDIGPQITGLTCLHSASGAAAPAPVSAPIDSFLNTKPVTFSKEVTR